MNLQQVLGQLEILADPEKIEIKERKFGIHAKNSLGVYHNELKVLAKEIGQDNKLAIELFDTGIYEARILCSKIFDPECISEEHMDQWVVGFENWEICDSFCMGFFVKSNFALSKAHEWSEAESEFVKRAGFVMMAAYGFANKKADNEVFEQFFLPIQREASDERLYVKKAVNWALRNIGKRNVDLHARAISIANRLLTTNSRSANWIAKNALNELKKSSVNILDYPRHIYRATANKMHIPTEQDWRSEPWGIDTDYGYRIFQGKDSDEAVNLFEENALSYQEGVFYMPDTCFRYYFDAYIRYLLSNRSEGDSDGASCFYGLVERRTATITSSNLDFISRVTLCLEHLGHRQEWFEASMDIYGNFSARSASCIALIQPAKQDDDLGTRINPKP